MQLIFFLLLLVFTIPTAFAASTTSSMTIEQPFIVLENIIELKENETLDLTNYILDVSDTETTIGNVSETFSKQVKIVAEINNENIALFNSDLDDVIVIFPDEITLLAPDSWDNMLLPPTEMSVMGDTPSGYQTSDGVIQIGSVNTIILFDKPVTIILKNVDGEIGHRLAGESSWNLIDTCSGTYANPGNPISPNECSINNNDHTKIVTYHFTHFAEFEIIEELEEESEIIFHRSSGAGHGRIGISPTNPGLGGALKTFDGINEWIKQPVTWWLDGNITDDEFSSMIEWLIDEDVIKIENKIKPDRLLIDMTPFTKSMFSLWERDLITDSEILKLIENFRMLGVW